jgi:HAD superfamily hydrolase (TIGR01484 family)
MKKLSDFKNKIEFLLTDIDDTLTDDGLLGAEAYQALWNLHNAGVHVIPVTGRPAGWCELIARQWPVSGVIGENGGFYFRYIDRDEGAQKTGEMKRHFIFTEDVQKKNREKLNTIRDEVLKTVPGCAVASDQFCRLMDLAIDFCEDVDPLPKSEVQKIVDIFKKHGAQAKVSSIHVNGWFGQYDKLSMTLEFLKREFGVDKDQALKSCAFSGDSPNDEPMFEFFPHSFAVANIKNFIDQIQYQPAYVADARGGQGFSEIAKAIQRNTKS